MALTISVFGLGYVGTVTAACLALRGHQVIGVDVNPEKVKATGAGRSPIVEPQVPEIIAKCHQQGRLRATSDFVSAVRESDISFICVGTPGGRSGKLDLGHIQAVCREIGQGISRQGKQHTVVLRSTVLPGTTESTVVPILEAESGKRAGSDFAVCVNPEFMREGTAVRDFLEPQMTILGGSSAEQLAPLRTVYDWVPGRVFETTIPVAEMVKYCCNAFHAVKVTFANEMGTLCKELGVDTQAATEIFLADSKLNISPAYLRPGFAFGGSCLPKDVRALTYRAKELDLKLPLLESLLPSNHEHVERAVQEILKTGKRKVGQLGLSFKAGTDDLRESPYVQLIKRLLGEGCQIEIWDDNVSLGRLIGSNRQFIEELIPHIGSLLRPSMEEVVAGAEVVLLGTSSVAKEVLEKHLRPEQILIDLVNLEKGRRVTRPVSAYAGICW